MATVTTSGTPYCTVAQFRTIYDKRTTKRLASDTGTPLTDSAMLTDEVILQALRSASGRLEIAVLTGKRYSVTDLQNLAASVNDDDDPTVGAAFLHELVAQIALWRLNVFRPNSKIPISPDMQEAMQMLKDLRAGEGILPFAEAADAGVMDFEDITDVDVRLRDDIVSQAKDYFGDRSPDRARP